MRNEQEVEEEEFGRGPLLWDAGEGVCCAAFQLGACSHTEAFDEPTEADIAVEETLDDIAHLAQALTLFDEGELSHDELVRLFQHLVDTGLAWSLQGSIGRLAVDLIEAGLVTA